MYFSYPSDTKDHILMTWSVIMNHIHNGARSHIDINVKILPLVNPYTYIIRKANSFHQVITEIIAFLQIRLEIR